MSDHGFRISADSVDVKTGADKDMVVTSKYSMLKGSISGSGTINVPRTSAPQTLTIAHGLSYIPMVQAFWNDKDGIIVGDGSAYFPAPMFYFDGVTAIAVQVKADATNIYLIFTIEDF